MTYSKTTWIDGKTPINQTNLNKMENGIKGAHDLVGSHNHNGVYAPNGYGIGDVCPQISSKNLNDYWRTGFYCGERIANAPTQDWYHIQVQSHTTAWIVQVATRLHTNERYYRRCYSGTWQPWTRILNNDDISQSNVANRAVVRDGSGDIHCRLLRQEYGDDGQANGAYFLTQKQVGAGDNYARPMNKEAVKNALGINGKEPKLSADRKRKTVYSTADPSGTDWDIWIKYK